MKETMKNLTLIEHPLLQHKLSYLRDKNTDSSVFRSIIKEMSRYLAYEATRDFALKSIKIDTPLSTCKVMRIKNPPIVVSIMRAGNGMLDAILTTLPFSQSGHIGIYRDKFIKNTVEYYFKIPEDAKGKKILLVDPLIATADTMIASIDRLKQYGVGEIRCLSILVSKYGIQELQKEHPDVNIFSIGLEEEVNKSGYLIPGLGDVGDRLFNAK